MKLSHSWREIAEVLHQQARPTPEYYVLCAIAGIVATFGLLMNNGTAIVGAILIAPLMGPMLGIGFSTLTGRRYSARQATLTLFLGVLIILGVSYLASLLFLNVGITEEMTNRAKPTLLNLLIAFPAGFLAGYTRIRKSLSDKVYGVAMSVTILPPLCIAGIALAQAEMSLFLGAALMFFSNLLGILVSSFAAFALSERSRIQRKHIGRLIFPSILILLLCIPLSVTFYDVSQTNRLQQIILQVLETKKSFFPHMEVADVDINIFQAPVTASVTLRSSTDFTGMPLQLNDSEASIQQQIEAVQALIGQRFQQRIQLTVHLLPVRTYHGK